MMSARRGIGALVGGAVIVACLALIGFGTQLVSAAGLTLNPSTFALQRTSPTPYVAVNGNFDVAASLDARALTLDPGTATFGATNVPTWAATTGSNGWELKTTGTGIADRKGSSSTADLARFPWMSTSSYVEVDYAAMSNSAFAGLCLLCANAASPTGMAARVEKRSSPANAWWMTLGEFSAGTWTQRAEVQVVSGNTAPTGKLMHLDYNATTFLMTATFNSTNAITWTVPASMRSNTYAGLVSWTGSTGTTFENLAARKPRS